jgi:hypothetical protein
LIATECMGIAARFEPKKVRASAGKMTAAGLVSR